MKLFLTFVHSCFVVECVFSISKIPKFFSSFYQAPTHKNEIYSVFFITSLLTTLLSRFLQDFEAYLDRVLLGLLSNMLKFVKE